MKGILRWCINHELISSAVITVLVVALISSISVVIHNKTPPKYTSQSLGVISSPVLSDTGTDPKNIDIYQLWSLTNKERQKVGLLNLVLDERLDKSAQVKCDDIVAKNYWSHDAPDGTQPWTIIKTQIPYYRKVGENLAAGQHTAQQMVEQWMSSEEHKANILDPGFQNVGFAVCKSEKFVESKGAPALITVQHFVGQ